MRWANFKMEVYDIGSKLILRKKKPETVHAPWTSAWLFRQKKWGIAYEDDRLCLTIPCSRFKQVLPFSTHLTRTSMFRTTAAFPFLIGFAYRNYEVVEFAVILVKRRLMISALFCFCLSISSWKSAKTSIRASIPLWRRKINSIHWCPIPAIRSSGIVGGF